MKEILSEEEVDKLGEDTCELCETHNAAYAHIPDGVVCPYCKHNNEYPDYEYKVIGTCNGYIPDEDIGKYPVVECEKCAEYIMMKPLKVMYNGNHDIYYTGEGHFLPYDKVKDDMFSKLSKELEEHITNWKRRTDAGELISVHNLVYWLKGDIESAIAQYLKEQGIKL